MTHPLTSLVARQRLYISLRDGEDESKTPKFCRNFAEYTPTNGDGELSTRNLLIHGKEFGDATFFRRLREGNIHKDDISGLPLIDKIAAFNACAAITSTYNVLMNKEAFRSPSEEHTVSKFGIPYTIKTGTIKTGILEREVAKDVAWNLLKTISDPYAKKFRNAETNIATCIAENADSLALKMTLQSSEPYKIITIQDKNLSNLEDVSKFYEPCGGLHCKITKRIYLSTTSDIHLSAQVFARNNEPFKRVISHEFGHAGNTTKQYELTREQLWKAVPEAQRDFCIYYLSLFNELQKSNPDVPPTGKKSIEYLTLRKKEGLTAKEALNYAQEDLQNIAATVWPFMDLRATTLSPYLTAKTCSKIKRLHEDFYQSQSEKMSEVPALMHELTTALPADWVKRMFPDLYRITGDELLQMQAQEHKQLAQTSRETAENQWHKRLEARETILIPAGQGLKAR